MRFVTATAPIRVADLGGWTDTWFAGHGLVCNVAVRPGAEVRIAVAAGGAGRRARIELVAENTGDRYVLPDGAGRHPLLEAAIDEVGVPDGLDVTIWVHSEIPAGASTGTSASVTVALVAALAALEPGRRLTPSDAARTAHRVESERLGRQTGIQDQWCAAVGGVSLLTMSRYPSDVEVTPVRLSPGTAWELEARMLLVFLGRTHVSSEVHERVIADLSGGGRDVAALLDPLRSAAAAGHSALVDGDLDRWGAALLANTAAQEALHPGLVGEDARRAFSVAAEHGARGWKVNGAGGEGGSVVVLCGPEPGAKRRLAAALRACDPGFVPISTTLDTDGLRVWEAMADG